MSADHSRRKPRADGPRHAAAGRGITLGPLRGYLDYALRQAQLAVSAGSGTLLSRFDLRPRQFAVLIVIDHNPGLRATDVCHALGFQKANFAPLLRALERHGLVRRRSSALDRRTQSLQLTPAGTRLLARVRRAHERQQQALSARLGQAATRRLISQLLELAGQE